MIFITDRRYRTYEKTSFSNILVVLSLLSWVIAFPHLPSQIPTHWDLNGNVNGYSSKVGAMLIMVGLIVFMYIMFIAVPKIDPKIYIFNL
ncbi:DUF1648 domain-containing protein [Lentibacillus songyuanensis]|uniref:DUF1648 domain-containing protein n=1 Tax=Lentibacillus songyuanensis TaxID=3136161 RepID=UPI0038621C7C